jgi:hypothetical protein
MALGENALLVANRRRILTGQHDGWNNPAATGSFDHE